jgi:hypothetical protein
MCAVRLRELDDPLVRDPVIERLGDHQLGLVGHAIGLSGRNIAVRMLTLG